MTKRHKLLIGGGIVVAAGVATVAFVLSRPPDTVAFHSKQAVAALSAPSSTGLDAYNSKLDTGKGAKPDSLSRLYRWSLNGAKEPASFKIEENLAGDLALLTPLDENGEPDMQAEQILWKLEGKWSLSSWTVAAGGILRRLSDRHPEMMQPERSTQILIEGLELYKNELKVLGYTGFAANSVDGKEHWYSTEEWVEKQKKMLAKHLAKREKRKAESMSRANALE